MAGVVALDVGTSGVRAVVFDREGAALGRASEPTPPRYPAPNHAEYDPVELQETARETLARAVEAGDVDRPAALGVTAHRATSVAWEADTGQPVDAALSWRDARTSDRVRDLSPGILSRVLDVTGLFPVSGYAAPKFEWLLDRGDRRDRARNGEVLVGTLTSYLVFCLTGRHVVDVTDAAATMLFDVHDLAWDEELLAAFDVPRACLPEVVPSSHRDAYGATDLDGLLASQVPVTASLGDQQAALFGHGSLEAGATAYTVGSGGFFKTVTGTRPVDDRGGLVSTIAFQGGDIPPTYMLEGPVTAAGGAVEWLAETGILPSVEAADTLAGRAERDPDLCVVPAFRGLGAPYWDETATGTVVGVTPATRREQLVRATLDAVAYRARDIFEALPADGPPVESVRVDGGLAASDHVCQAVADVLGVDVLRPPGPDATTVGAARAAGRALDSWAGSLVTPDSDCRTFEPAGDSAIDAGYDRWQDALDVARGWQT